MGVIAFVVTTIKAAQLAQEENTNRMAIHPFRTFANPSGFRPDHFMDDFFERCQNAGEITGVLAIERDSCRRIQRVPHRQGGFSDAALGGDRRAESQSGVLPGDRRPGNRDSQAQANYR